MNPEFDNLSVAEKYEAMQLGDEVVVIARGQRALGRIVALRESAVKSDHDFSLFEYPPFEAAEGQHGIEKFTAFRGFHSTIPVTVVRILDKQGIKTIPVSYHPEGITPGGTELLLPLVSSSLALTSVVERMKSADSRAVVATFAPTDYRVFLNYQIVDALFNNEDLNSIKESGHRVATVSGITLPFARRALFTMAAPPLTSAFVRVISLFEDIGGAVSSTSKVCFCSSLDKNHTVKDSYPSLDASPCPKFPQGHGTLSCF